MKKELNCSTCQFNKMTRHGFHICAMANTQFGRVEEEAMRVAERGERFYIPPGCPLRQQ